MLSYHAQGQYIKKVSLEQMTAYFEGLGYASYLVGEHDLLHLTPGSLATIGSFKDWSSGTVETAVSRPERRYWPLAAPVVCKPSSGLLYAPATPAGGAGASSPVGTTEGHGHSHSAAIAHTLSRGTLLMLPVIVAFDRPGATCLPCARRCPSTPGWCYCSTGGNFHAPKN